MSVSLRAKWILPIDRPPIEDGWIEVGNGRVVGVGAGRRPPGTRDQGEVALLPGLVNAHTHLELSWLAGRIPPANSMDEWIRALLTVRRAGVPGGRRTEEQAARTGAETMVATGTVLAGDVSNTLITPPLLALAGLGGVVFHELLGFNALDPAGTVRDAWVRAADAQSLAATTHRSPTARSAKSGLARLPLSVSVVGHAPYSVSPALLASIAARADDSPLSIHLGESVEELEFLKTGRGPIRQLLEQLGVWSGSWVAPNCDPVQYVAALGYLRPGTLVVHAVHLTDDGLERLRRVGAVVVTCPRSNLWVGAGPPRLARFYAAGLPVAVGTDSLASSPSLNLFDELAEMRRLAPEVSAGTLLESATRVGASALGFDHDFGTIGIGKRATLTQVAIPAGTTDVEEYLVSGVPPDRITPLRF